MSLVTDSVAGQTAANKRRQRLLLGAFAVAVFVVVAAILGLLIGPSALIVAAVAAAGATAMLVQQADALVLSRIGADPVDPHTHARVQNLVDGLSVSAGVPTPTLLVLDDPATNACSVGRDPRHASIIVTRGLLETLPRIELEGVLAHELSHIKNHDTALATVAIALVGAVAPGLLPKAIGPDSEAAADVSGVALTRYPPGLISALETMRDDGATLRSPNRAVAHLWIVGPSDHPSHPPLEERIQALREL